MRFPRSITQQVRSLSAGFEVFAQTGILLAAGVSIGLCGGMPQGSLGIFLGVSAIMLVFVPPKTRQPCVVWLVACVVVGAGGLALLPSGILESPAWRQALLADGACGAWDAISVVPEETLFWLSVLASTLVLGIYLLSQPVGPTAMMGLAAGASLFCAAYAGMAVYAELTGWKTAFDAGPSFGFFANRNHVATLLITGALTGAGALAAGISRKQPLVVLCGAIGVAVCGLSIMMISPSRAGVFLLLGGAGMWVAGLGRRRITPRVIVSSLVLLVVALVFFLGIDNPAARRMIGEWGPSPMGALASDYRFKVYQDALRLWSDFPLTGSGLGSYRFLYPWYADSSLTEVTTIHPESDWLLLGLEAGPLAIVGAIALLVLVSRTFFSLREHQGWSVRWAVVTAATIALIHGIFDVPLHRIELGWWVLILLCLGLGRPPERNEAAEGTHWQRVAFLIAGIFVGVLAWQLISAEWFRGRSLPPYAAKLATQKILAEHEAGRFEEALDLAIEESARSPMERDLHYQRGVLALHFEGTEAEVDAAFASAKMLSPNWPGLRREMGKAWYPVDKSKAAALWLEAVERQARIDRVVHGDRPPGEKLFSDILAQMSKDPAALHLLKPPLTFDPELHFSWIRFVRDGREHFEELASSPQFLHKLTEPQKTEFLILWSAYGEKDAMQKFLEDQPAWDEAAWSIRIQDLVEDDKHQEATTRLASRFLVSLKLPSVSGPFEHPLEADYMAMVSARNQVAARRILNEAANSTGTRLSVAHRLAAATAFQAGEWAVAYKHLVAHLKASGQKLPANL